MYLMGASQEDLASLAAFIDLFGASVPGGVQTFFTLQGRRHDHFSVGDSYSAAAFAVEMSRQRRDVYIRANVQALGGTKVATVAAMTALTVDFDLAGPGHKVANLPTSPDVLWQLLHVAQVPEPTVVLKTGGGLLVVWILDQAFIIQSEADRTTAVALSNRFQGRIAQVASQLGFHLDHTADLVRSCRLPGLKNWKEAYGPDGATVTVDAWSGRKITLAEAEQVAAGWEPPAKSAPKLKKRISKAIDQEGDGGNCNWDAIYIGCRALRNWADTAEGLPEPQWYALASVVGRAANGRAHFHSLSEEDPRYDREATDKKLDQALAASPPRLCGGIRDLGGDCTNCPHQGRINSPIALGYADYRVIELATRFVYVADANGFIDLQDLRGRG
jgi:hypothetical protein